MADGITSPWWYHVGLGLSLAFALASMSLRFASFGVPGAMLAFFLLTWALKRTTGLALDRYSATAGARRVSTVHVLTSLALVLPAAVLEWGFDVIGALAVAGVLVGVLTVIMGYRVDEAVRRDLRAGHDQTAV
ncbi:hypothetical protein ABZ897_36530 [Nonomuraea sp. NPDC046802]|uniref:hypothetical protein n=1 Tax=Nonomuraea sp. NPDC046802 TaxID=3154919 RepID=UPI0033CA2973